MDRHRIVNGRADTGCMQVRLSRDAIGWSNDVLVENMLSARPASRRAQCRVGESFVIEGCD